jgi:hypothetical protein
MTPRLTFGERIHAMQAYLDRFGAPFPIKDVSVRTDAAREAIAQSCLGAVKRARGFSGDEVDALAAIGERPVDMNCDFIGMEQGVG